ncbi:hypothetical protein J6590_003963 [Homalodisca vitripennis]|nr:hypothetical protein J6590_003963 [Homalodisca vitripennis]
MPAADRYRRHCDHLFPYRLSRPSSWSVCMFDCFRTEGLRKFPPRQFKFYSQVPKFEEQWRKIRVFYGPERNQRPSADLVIVKLNSKWYQPEPDTAECTGARATPSTDFRRKQPPETATGVCITTPPVQNLRLSYWAKITLVKRSNNKTENS